MHKTIAAEIAKLREVADTLDNYAGLSDFGDGRHDLRIESHNLTNIADAIENAMKLPFGYHPAGHRDGHDIYVRNYNPITDRELKWPDVIVNKDGKVKVFPSNRENMTHGGLVDQFFRNGGLK